MSSLVRVRVRAVLGSSTLARAPDRLNRRFFFVRSHNHEKRPSVYPSACISAFPWNLSLETLVKLYGEIRNLVKMGQKNIGPFTCRSKYVLLLPATWFRRNSFFIHHLIFFYCWQWHETQQCIENTLLHFHSSSCLLERAPLLRSCNVLRNG